MAAVYMVTAAISRSPAAKVTARGGNYGAGIGGGAYGNGSDITVTGGEVTANSGNYGAGIGGGGWGNGNNITISGGKVTATGGMFAAGIGGGMHRDEMTSRSPAARSVPPEASAAQALAAALMHAAAETSRFPAMRS